MSVESITSDALSLTPLAKTKTIPKGIIDHPHFVHKSAFPMFIVLDIREEIYAPLNKLQGKLTQFLTGIQGLSMPRDI